MSGTLTMDGRQSVPPSLTLGYAPWTWPFSLSSQRAAPSRRATLRDQHASCAHPSGIMSSRVGTPPMCGAQCKC